MKLTAWSPKFASSLIHDSLTYDDKYDLYPTYWHTGVLFHKNLGSGKSGEYLGTSLEWYNLVNKTYMSKYLNPATHPYGDVIMDSIYIIFHFILIDYIEDVALGSAIGITIERGLSMIDSIYNDSDIYEQGELLVNTIHNLGTCSNNNNKQCSLDSDCGKDSDDVICKPWNTFYGDILINKETGDNYKKQYIVGQIQPNHSKNDSLEMKFVYPSTISECNINTQCLETNFDSCSCNAIYPAEWPWEILEAEDSIYISNSIGIVHIILILIFMLVVISFAFFVLYTKEKYIFY